MAAPPAVATAARRGLILSPGGLFATLRVYCRRSPVLGQVEWDSPDAGNEHVVMHAPASARNEVLRNRFVHVRDDVAGRDFLARISDGPFFPLSKDGASGLLARLEIQGELDSGRLYDTATRPSPGATVIPLEDSEVAGLIGSRGDMLLGVLSGH